MSKILYSAPIDELVGQLAGSVFQDSYFGTQIRTKVSPRNASTYYNQLRRGQFGYLSATWRFLSAADLATWVAAAGTIPAAFRLFMSCNINLSLLNIAPISNLITSGAPVLFPISVVDFSAPTFSITAATSLNTVPVGFSLLLFATAEKPPPKNFTNPSMYSPIVAYGGGTSLAGVVSIAADWILRYGQFKTNQRICLKCCLIKNSNGFRGSDYIVCAISPTTIVNQIISDLADVLVDNTGDIITFP